MDSAAFRQLALAEIDAVYRMAMHLARHPDEASDLVQETYLKAFKAEARFELGDRGVKPWLFKILHNSFYTRYQKRKREPTLPDDYIHESTPSELDEPPPAWDLEHLDWEQVDDRLKHAIEELPDHYREVLLLWAVEGLKYREIGEVLGVALGTVMSRLYRARGILSKQLAEYAAEQGIAVG
ncbi:MAG: sigma-70 family RNA polymerase sigma factor [Planctomycetota bacterium]